MATIESPKVRSLIQQAKKAIEALDSITGKDDNRESPSSRGALRTHPFSVKGTNPEYEERLKEFTKLYKKAIQIPVTRLDKWEHTFLYGNTKETVGFHYRFEEFGPRPPVSEKQIQMIKKIIRERG